MDVALRAIVAFLFILLITRVVGRRELSSLEPFDVILLVVMGDLIQQGVTQADTSTTGIMIAVGVFALMAVATSYASFRFKRLRPVLDGESRFLFTYGDGVTDLNIAAVVDFHRRSP